MVTRGRREAAPALGTPLGQPSPAIKYAAEGREPPNAGRSRSLRPAGLNEQGRPNTKSRGTEGPGEREGKGRPAGLKDQLDPTPRPEGLKAQGERVGKERVGKGRPAGRTPATTSPSPPSPAGHDEGGAQELRPAGLKNQANAKGKAVPRDPDRPGDRLTHPRTNPEPRAPTQPPRKKSTCTPRGPSVTRWPSFLGPATG